MSDVKEAAREIIAGLGITMKAQFVPCSQSRNRNEKYQTLNWLVTIKINDHTVLTTDYSCGCAFCPSYKQGDNSVEQHERIVYECEQGRSHPTKAARGKILPDIVDVIHSLVLDSYAIDHGSFEEWASESGYDTDSRKAEAIYRQCIEIGLKLSKGIGIFNVDALRKAVSDL